MKAAIAEFGERSYDQASLNEMCHRNNISKGLIYYNYRNKDDLYLRVVKKCYDELLEYLNDQFLENLKMEELPVHLIQLRREFFDQNPYYERIYSNSFLRVPDHLARDLKEIREGLVDFNRTHEREAAEKEKLRQGMTPDDVLKTMAEFQSMATSYMQEKCEAFETSADYDRIFRETEDEIGRLASILVRGLLA